MTSELGVPSFSAFGNGSPAIIARGSPGGFVCLLCNPPAQYKHSTFGKHLKDKHDKNLKEEKEKKTIDFSNEVEKFYGYVCDLCEGYHTKDKRNYHRHLTKENHPEGEAVMQQRSCYEWKHTGHFKSLTDSSINTLLIPEEAGYDVLDHLMDFIKSQDSIHQELVGKFGVHGPLAYAIKDFVCAATNGHPLEIFASEFQASIVSTNLPPKLAAIAEEWIRRVARPLSKILPGSVKAALATFKKNADHEILFNMMENENVLVEELKSLLTFFMGSDSGYVFGEVQNFLHLCQKLYTAATEEGISGNTRGIPLISRYVIFRLVDMKGDSPRLRGMYALSSIVARVVHLVRLAGSTLCSAVTGPNGIPRQLELADAMQASQFINFTCPLIRSIRQYQQSIPPRTNDEILDNGDLFIGGNYYRKAIWSQLVQIIYERVCGWFSRLLVPNSSSVALEKFMEMNTVIKMTDQEDVFSVNDTNGLEFFTFTSDIIGNDECKLAAEHIAADLRLAFHGLSFGVRRNSEIEDLHKIKCRYSNWLVRFFAICKKVPSMGQSQASNGVIEHRLPWRLGRLYLLFRLMLKATGLKLLYMFNQADSMKEIFQLKARPNLTDVRNVFANIGNIIYGVTDVNNASVDKFFWQTGHKQSVHMKYYCTRQNYSTEYEYWHCQFGEVKFKGPSGIVTTQECLTQLKRHLGPNATFRGGQHEMMEAINNGSDLICLQPPGGGKSLCWKLPAAAAECSGASIGSIFVVVPYGFLGCHHREGLEQAGVESEILKSSQIDNGNVPSLFQNGFLPSVVFMTIDTFGKLLEECTDFLWLAITRGLIGKIIFDEIHLLFLDLDFRSVFRCLQDIRTKLQHVQLVFLSGSLPSDMTHQNLLVFLGMSEERVEIQESDSIGLEGIPLEVKDWDGNPNEVVDCVVEHLHGGRHVHVFCRSKVACKDYCELLRVSLKDPTVNVRTITSETTDPAKHEICSMVQAGECDVLISTTSCLVGYENKKCRTVIFVNHMFNIPSIVQGLGRLRVGQRENCHAYFFATWQDMNKDDTVPEDAAIRKTTLWSDRVDRFTSGAALSEFLKTNGCRMQFLSRDMDFSTGQPCGICDNCRDSRGLGQDLINLSQCSLGTIIHSSGTSEPGQHSPSDIINLSQSSLGTVVTKGSPVSTQLSSNEDMAYLLNDLGVSDYNFRKVTAVTPGKVGTKSLSKLRHCLGQRTTPNNPYAQHRSKVPQVTPRERMSAETSQIHSNKPVKKPAATPAYWLPQSCPGTASESALKQKDLLVIPDRSKRPATVGCYNISLPDLLALLQTKCVFCDKVDCTGTKCIPHRTCILCGGANHRSNDCDNKWRDQLKGVACFGCAIRSPSGSKCNSEQCNKIGFRLLRLILSATEGRPFHTNYEDDTTFEAFVLECYKTTKSAKSSTNTSSRDAHQSKKRVRHW